jgi:hypothetical protein
MISLTYDWERAYIDAILETDDEKLTKSVDTAGEKLLARIHELNNDHDGNAEEVQRLATALGGLHKMRIERLGATGW